jgi:hypothetical protein
MSQTTTTIEGRLETLEREMADLKRRLAPAEQDDNWVDRITGIMEGDPHFAEVVRLGREARMADRPSDAQGE